MAIARFILQNWFYFVGAGLVLLISAWVLTEIHDARVKRRRRDDSRGRIHDPWVPMEILRKSRPAWPQNPGCWSGALGFLLLIIPGIAWMTNDVSGKIYNARQQHPTWPDLRLTLDISPATGTFTEGDMFTLTVTATNQSDVPVLLESLTLPFSEGIVPDYLHATQPLTQTSAASGIKWGVRVTLAPGQTWIVSMPIQFATFGNCQGNLIASVTAERSYEQYYWDDKNVRPEDTPILKTEIQPGQGQAPISWTVLRK